RSPRGWRLTTALTPTSASSISLVTPRLPARSTGPRSGLGHTRRLTRSDGASTPDDHIIVLYGALGDLSTRKLLPGLFHLDRAGLMPANYKIIGTSRKGGTAKDFREVAKKAIGSAAGETFARFAERLEFSAFSAEDPSPLVDAVAKAEKELGDSPRR